MWKGFNINDYVKVKITPEGHKVLRRLDHSIGVEYKKPAEDEDGWSKWQMHDLIAKFGNSMPCFGPVSFETNILIQFEETE